MSILVKIVLGIALLIVLTTSQQQVPIPAQPYGFTLREDSGYKLHLQFNIDFLCPDSQNSYNILKKVIGSASTKLKYTFLFSPLSWHYYSFKLHQAFFFIVENAGREAGAKYIDLIMAEQDDFSEEENRDMSTRQFLDSFAKKMAIIFKVDYQKFREQLEFGTLGFNHARYHWKFVVGQLGVGGTPIFYANGVRVDGADNWGSEEWQQFIVKFQ